MTDRPARKSVKRGTKPRAKPTPNRGSQLLRRWMKTTGTTQEALAEQLGVSQVTVSLWRNGRVPRVRKMLQLLELCRIPIRAWAEPELEEKAGPKGEADARATGTEG